MAQHSNKDSDRPEGDNDLIPLDALRAANRLCDEYEQQLRSGGQPDAAAYLTRADNTARRWVAEQLIGTVADLMGQAALSGLVLEMTTAFPELAGAIHDLVEQEKRGPRTERFEEATGSETEPRNARKRTSRGLRLRCPHCSNHVELLGDTPLDSVDCDTCGSNFSLVDRAAETRMAQALQKIDRFELVSRLGVGGFGTVWKARDTDLDRSVAVKIPRHGQLSPDETEQFFREARSVAQLRHQNIVPVHEVGREGDTVFIVSDLVRGISLSDELTGRRFTQSEAALLVQTLAEALHHAHEAGVVHRDLKPSNIMIDSKGEPVLMDFGLAKREAEEVTMTVEGVILGTPAYMSPEQAEGRSAWVDRRTDIYSLGVILFELLTGELPFQGNAQRQVEVRLREDAPDIRSRNPYLDRDLATITAKSLERKPGQRYQTAAEVAGELDRYLSNKPIVARPVSRIERGVRWAQRNPLLTVTTVLLILLAVLGPSAALLIESQRSRLARTLEQRDRLAAARIDESRQANAIQNELSDQLDLWKGNGDPFGLWPPRADRSPQRLALASMLNSRRSELEQTHETDSPELVAHRTLTLAALHQGLGQKTSAKRSLLEASKALQALTNADPDSPSIPAALTDVYIRLAELSSGSDEQKKWLLKAWDFRGSADAALDRPVWLSQRLNAALLSGAASGKEGAPEYLAASQELLGRIEASWPDEDAELYRLASILSGRIPYLLPETKEDR